MADTRKQDEEAADAYVAGKGVAFTRASSFMRLGAAEFIFQTPVTDDAEEFELALREELARLQELLSHQLQSVDASQAGPMAEQLQKVAAVNAEAASDAIKDVGHLFEDADNKEDAASEKLEELQQMVRMAFLQQGLLISAWHRQDEEADSATYSPHRDLWVVLILISILLAVATGSKFLAESWERCALLIATLLGLQLSGLMPLYTIGIMMPVLATSLAVLPDRSMRETAHLCFGAMFNEMTALVIGTFTVNAVFVSCQLETRFLERLNRTFGQSPKTCLLVLMLGCMYASAFTFVTLLMLAAMLPICLSSEGSGSKSLLLGVGMACTLGGGLTPISGTTSLIAVSALTEYGVTLNFLDWICISVPVLTLSCIALWAWLLLLFGEPPAFVSGGKGAEPSVIKGLTPSHYFFILICAGFVLGCAFPAPLEAINGSSGNLGLLLTALAFGSGFLKKSDFLALPWEVLMILFGVNVLSFALKESGLALVLANALIPAHVYDVWLWWELAKFTGVTVLIASITGHTVFGTLALPILVALGAKLYAPLLTTILATLAIHIGQMTPYASTDLILTLETSENGASTGASGGRLPSRNDFVKAGFGMTIIGWLLIISLAYGLGLGMIGVPPKHIVIAEPEELIPTVRWMNETSDAEKAEILEKKVEGKTASGPSGNRTEVKVRKVESFESKPLDPIGVASTKNADVKYLRRPRTPSEWRRQQQLRKEEELEEDDEPAASPRESSWYEFGGAASF